MAEKNNVVIAGFVFENEAEAEQAAKEAEGVKYIKAKTDMDNPEMVLQIYNKIIQQKLFETAVGFAYLKDLQDYLISIPYVAKDAVLPIPVSHKALEKNIRKKLKLTAKPKDTQQKTPQQKSRKPSGKQETAYRTKFRVTLLLAVIMAVSMVGMFFITASSNNLNILNYENELINRYEDWETSLSQREAAIEEREAELGITGQE